jgi:hypothetical protein
MGVVTIFELKTAKYKAKSYEKITFSRFVYFRNLVRFN